MGLIRPHAYFLVGACRQATVLPYTLLNTKVPNGAAFRIDYVLVSYPLLVGTEGTVQLSADLTFTFAISDGLRYQNVPIVFKDITTPAGGNKVRASEGLRIEVPPNAWITLEVRCPTPSQVPPTFSVTYLGRKGWGNR